MTMVLALHFSAALLLFLTEPPKQGAEAFPVTCCLKTCDAKVRRELLKNYSIQVKPLCPVNAVRFVTKMGITFCLDPSSPWAINTMAFLDNRGMLPGNSTTTINTSHV
ncbi:monocyte chemotactic protein 1B [Ictalurus furcatus]|uniref:monocyte chemotactic protein 1B n=1 Tax=Ictalurus furcatus TaxID=66913 RepID=UPI00235054C9|nr:monocyte chemotactic protein 1B [Ictalurus furcatus]